MPRQGTTGQSWVQFASVPTRGYPDGIGGIVRAFKAAAALVVGDAVFLSASDTVNKAAGTVTTVVGIVVGGTATGLECCDSTADVGLAAAAANDIALVCVRGVAYAKAGGAITIGLPVILDPSTSGAVIAGTTAGAVIGRAEDAATNAGDVLRVRM